jgi:FG-GAP repeat
MRALAVAPGRNRLSTLAWAGCALLAAVLAATLVAGAGPRGWAPVPSAAPVSPSAGLASIPVPARGPVSAALGRRDPAYWVRGLRAATPAQGLRETFSRTGVTVASGAGHVHLSLTGFVTAAPPVIRANRVVYARAGLDEWFANGPLGLEQGFDVLRPPSATSGRLGLPIALSGNLHASMTGGSLLLTGHGASLRYGGLVAVDAGGRRLPTSLTLRGERLTLMVQARGARYPVRIDPFVAGGNLNEPAGSANDAFGYTTAVSGSTIVVGASGHAVNGHSSQGAAFVFTEPATGWATTTQSTMLTASDGATNDSLGFTVATNGTMIVAGAPGHAGGQGAAYVWVQQNGSWPTSDTAELTAPDGAASDAGGYLPVAISPDGNTVVFGAGHHTVGGHIEQGAAYAFTKPAGGWGSAAPAVAELTASDGAANDVFGLEVAAADDTVAVQGGLNGGGSAQGAIYVYTRAGAAWTSGVQQAELTATGDPSLGIGSNSLAISADGATIAAGAPTNQADANTYAGAVFVFARQGSVWSNATSQSATLTASDGAAADDLGFAVGTSGATIVAGAPAHAANAGAVYVFNEPPSGWSGTLEQTQELPASTGGTIGALGYSLGFDGNTIAAGTRAHQLGDYVFTQPSTTTTTSGPGATAPPTNTGLPAVSGTAKAGGKLTCSPGGWTGAPTSFVYQWYRDGTPIQGATSSTYTVQKSDEQLTLTCAVTTSNAAGAARAADSKAVAVPVPKVKGCPAATGTLSGSGLGRLRLGMTRARARHAYTKSSNRGKRYEDFFCLTPIGVRAGYGSPALLEAVPNKKRGAYLGRVAWASTASAYYAAHGIRVGATIAAAGQVLKLTGPFKIGLNDWYLAPNGASTAVFKARRAVIQEIGIADKSLTNSTKADKRFLRSFS